MRWIVAMLLLLAGPARAQPVDVWWPLYEGRAIISGTTSETRGDAVVQAFRRVLVKMSGDPSLLEDARVGPFDAMAAGMVEDFFYRDRMGDEPHHDEQGTRDRPFDFTAHFDQEKINATLTLLGRKPFLLPRPKLVIRITVEKDGHRFPMTADAEDDEQQREALLAAAERFGMRVVLPDSTNIAPPSAGAFVLSGTLVWRPAEGGWAGRWHFQPGQPRAGTTTFELLNSFPGLPAGARPRDWTITGVSFDDAFRDAVGGSLATLAGVAK